MQVLYAFGIYFCWQINRFGNNQIMFVGPCKISFQILAIKMQFSDGFNSRDKAATYKVFSTKKIKKQAQLYTQETKSKQLVYRFFYTGRLFALFFPVSIFLF